MSDRTRPFLHVVVMSVADASRRRRAYALMGGQGERLRSGVYELVASRRQIDELALSLGAVLAEGDLVRIYPVPDRSRPEIRLFGDGEVATLPVAWFF